MEQYKILVLSTGHLPHNEFEALHPDTQEEPYRSIPHEYGVILRLHYLDETLETVEDSFPTFPKEFPNLWNIFKYAHANDFSYIDFEEDAELTEEFPEFNW